MRKIDADALELDADYDDGEYWAVSMAQIQNAPTIEPEIIRCKDCRYADEDGVCQNSKGLAIQDDYDFCSYAERRTDE